MSEPETSRLLQPLSFTAWIKLVIAISLVLAIASGTVLYRRMHLWYPDYGADAVQDDSSIFVAPVGILDENAKFAEITSFEDAAPRAAPPLPDPVAPEDILNPQWKAPSFAGVSFPPA